VDATVKATALLHDPMFLEHRAPDRHGLFGHPERPERLEAIVACLENDGILDRLVTVRPPAATEEQLAAVHDGQHLHSIRAFAEEQGGGFIDPDTYAIPASYGIALHAAGAAIHGVDLVLDHQVTRAFALARPPGHHAMRARAMGFCLFNSIAAAAARARARGLERILVIDWDVHHGNGTQEIFFSDPGVLYLSTHQWPLYPGSGVVHETGEGKGRGATVNVPLPAATGDDGYRCVFEQVVVPVARRFAPELILISAGYDAHADDPLAGMNVSTAGFAAMARVVTGLADELCDGKLVASLEGGYNLGALADSVLETLAAFAGEKSRREGEEHRPAGKEHRPAERSAGGAAEVVEAVRLAHDLRLKD
jgi:acetoin utilization deacetylase AcuC-like enzyme